MWWRPFVANPPLSVIIPAYGRSEDLKGLLRSVQPDETTHEINVVDDCSENPGEFDQLKLEFPAVRFVHLDRNAGPGQARNKGAQNASGDVLLYLDSDTELEAGGIDLVIDYFQSNPEINMCSGWDSPIPLNEGFFPRFKALFMVSGAPNKDADVSFLAGRCFAIRRKIMLESGGFDPTYKNADVEDFELGYRLRKNYGKIRFLHTLRVRHRYPGLWKQFQLYYSRVKMWVELRASTGGFDESFGTGQFGTSRNDALIQLLSAVWPAAIVMFWAFGSIYPGLIVAVFAIGMNHRFLTLCFKEEGPFFLAGSVLCHSLLAVAILAGGIVTVSKNPKLIARLLG